METKTLEIMPPIDDPEIKKLEKNWNEEKEKVLVRGMVTQEAAEFLEKMAFEDFGMMKKGAIGMELTKLLLIARDCIKSKDEK